MNETITADLFNDDERAGEVYDQYADFYLEMSDRLALVAANEAKDGHAEEAMRALSGVLSYREAAELALQRQFHIW